MANMLKQRLAFTVSLISLLVLSACSKTDKALVGNGDINDSAASSSTGRQDLSDIADRPATEYVSLAVSTACIGCGKCLRIDPEHFAGVQGSTKVEAVSEENLESPTLEDAIRICPVNAIIRS